MEIITNDFGIEWKRKDGIVHKADYDDLIKSFEKQIPKKPIEQIKMLGLDKGGKCPSCQKYINNNRHWIYCECGQKIDWN